MTKVTELGQNAKTVTENTEVLDPKSEVTEVAVPTKQKSSVASMKTYLKFLKRPKSKQRKPKETTALC